MTLAEELKWRGFIQDTTLENAERLDDHAWTLYIGFDATALSQTVGNLAPMMAVKTFLRHGHKAIILAGGATSLIGDPGGKENERILQSKDRIAANVANAQAQFALIFGKAPVTYVNNLDWYKDFNVLDFLRDVGKNFSMTPLIQRDYIASRLGEGGAGISYAEFSYTLLQGYDYLKLFEDYGCNLQLGGSDQWGNCISGVDLIRRKHGQAVHVVTLPLVINQATGKKFGKSEEQTVWLDPALTHPSDFYQFWLNTSDLDALNYLKIFTELDKEEIEGVGREQAADPAGRAAQRRLAESVTAAIHGADNLRICRAFAQLAFPGSRKDKGADADWPDVLELEPAARKIRLGDGTGSWQPAVLFDELLSKLPGVESRTQIKELLDNKAVKVVVKNAEDTDLSIQPLDSRRTALGGEPVLIIIGKNTIRAIAE
ncbi:tyrosine--tRNA ligase [Candidatus Saccharibacteria bacterium]|nr:tyrosine--tRNA ligase [Candidatus Saccharibacteria bacterium]